MKATTPRVVVVRVEGEYVSKTMNSQYRELNTKLNADFEHEDQILGVMELK
jgi:hypothetical protein